LKTANAISINCTICPSGKSQKSTTRQSVTVIRLRRTHKYKHGINLMARLIYICVVCGDWKGR
jgi:hypothetical protein